ncbi:MAG: T9SS type A sorting domain-containing protein [Saprospiraceae bacterium]|nr:T9SS type A sorting domain-containing protein [Saprospiraceae bacterium]
MKTFAIIGMLIITVSSLWAQTPKLYVHIVSHNEPTDNLDAPPGLNYATAKANVLKMAVLVNEKNVKWNLQTSDGFVIGALQFDSGGTSTTDVFETLANPPYEDNIEIDPRSKNKSGRNIADQYYLLDSLGASPSTTVGGFLCYICEPSSMEIDWWQYQDTIIGAIYGNKVKFDLLSGAGSAGATVHCNDFYDFGIFKPDSPSNFYQHNPDRNLWCLGTGCAPILDSLDDEQAIIDLIKGQADSIQLGLWPQDKFYVSRIMTNQREYGPMFFKKMAKVIDALNQVDAQKLQWATIGETFTAFQEWQAATGLDHSQWGCGQQVTQIGRDASEEGIKIYPNPVPDQITVDISDQLTHEVEIFDHLGRLVTRTQGRSSLSLDLSALKSGMYLLRVEDRVFKLIKQ